MPVAMIDVNISIAARLVPDLVHAPDPDPVLVQVPDLAADLINQQ